MPTERMLFVKYLGKLNSGLAQRIQSKDWRLDGPGTTPRQPVTWKEAARAVSMMLEERADIHATVGVNEAVYGLVDSAGPGLIPQNGNLAQAPSGAAGKPNSAGKGPGAKSQGKIAACKYCGFTDHDKQICPQRASDNRGDTAAAQTMHARNGTSCSVCYSTNHFDRAHREGVQDYGNARAKTGAGQPSGAQQGAGEQGGGKQKGKEKWANSPKGQTRLRAASKAVLASSNSQRRRAIPQLGRRRARSRSVLMA